MKSERDRMPGFCRWLPFYGYSEMRSLAVTRHERSLNRLENICGAPVGRLFGS